MINTFSTVKENGRIEHVDCLEADGINGRVERVDRVEVDEELEEVTRDRWIR